MRICRIRKKQTSDIGPNIIIRHCSIQHTTYTFLSHFFRFASLPLQFFFPRKHCISMYAYHLCWYDLEITPYFSKIIERRDKTTHKDATPSQSYECVWFLQLIDYLLATCCKISLHICNNGQNIRENWTNAEIGNYDFHLVEFLSNIENWHSRTTNFWATFADSNNSSGKKSLIHFHLRISSLFVL